MQAIDIIIAVYVVFLWSINLVIQKFLSNAISLEIFNFLRFCSCLPLLFIFRRPPSPILKLIAVGLFWNVFCFYFIGKSLESGTGAGLIAVIYQTCVFFGVLFCFILIKEIPKVHQLIGMLIAFLGVFLLLKNNISNQVNFQGIAYAFSAAMCWGMGIGLIKRYKLTCDISTNVWLANIAIIPMGILSFFKEGPRWFEVLQDISSEVVSGVLFAAYGAGLLGGSLWFWLLKKYPSAQITPFVILLSPFSCIMSYLLLEEDFTPLQLLAFMIILLGIAITQNIFKLSQIKFKLVNLRSSTLWKKLISTN